MTHDLTTASADPTRGLRPTAGGAALSATPWVVAPGTADRDSLNLSLVLQAVRQHWRMIGLVGVVAGCLGWSIASLLPPKYMATALVRVDGDGVGVLEEETRARNPYVDPVRVQSWVHAMTGISVLRRAADEAGLRYFPEFNGFLAAAGKPRKTGQSPAMPLDDGMTPVERATISGLSSALNVMQIGQSGVAQIDVTASDPVVAARAANAVGDAFIEQQILSARGRRLQALDALTAQRDELNDRLRALEQNIVRVRSGSKLVFGETTDVAGDVFANIRQQLIVGESDLSAATAKRQIIDQARSAGAGAGELTNVAFSDLIQALRERRAQAYAELAEAGEVYGPRHPEYLKKQESLAKIDRSIDRELGSLSSTVRNEERVLQTKVNKLRQRLQEVQSEAAEGTSSRVQLARLQNEADGTKTSLNTLDTQIDAIETAVGLEQAEAAFVSRAVAPDAPYYPKKTLIAAAGGIAGAGLAFLFVAIRSLRQRRIGTVTQLKSFEAIAGFPVIASLPMQREGLVPAQVGMSSEYARVLIDLATTLGVGSSRMGSIVVAPLQEGDGGTSVAVSLALMCRGVGLKTLIVELDPERSVTQIFGGEGHLGLVDCSRQGIDPESTIWITDDQGLHVLGYGADARGLDYQTMAAVEQVYDRLQSRYDVVILDAPPLSSARHACRIVQRADQMLVVTLASGSRADALAYALRGLNWESAGKVAVVFNKVPQDSELLAA
jgi:Uncharacterized protein involved in exopolysaccharide biosynthesis